MTKIKRIILMLAVFIFCVPAVFFASGCDDNRPPDIVVTVFPIYDWTMVILGDNPANFKVRYLLETGVDLHAFDPSAIDRAYIASCYLFIYVGGKSDGWTLGALAGQHQTNEYRRTLRLMEQLDEGALLQGGDDCCGGLEPDEHIWMSIRFAKIFIDAILYELKSLDPANSAYYTANAAAYIAQLEKLDQEFMAMVENASQDTIVVADRFPFLYLVRDYGISFYAAFDGCSIVTDVPLARRIHLINTVNRLNSRAILTINNTYLANTIRDTADHNPEVLFLEDFQTVSRVRINQGFSYIDGMRTNLQALTKALA